MKSFDLFQKVTVDNSSKPTMIGAILSLSAITIMLFVFLKQVNEYFFIPLIQKDTIIFQDDTQESKVLVNLDIIFPNLPCAVISVDQEDLVGHHRLNIEDSLTKIPIDKERTPNSNKFDGRKTQLLRDAITNQEGCIVAGNVPISKVQGDIHISHHAYRDIYSYLLESGLNEKITLNHKFTLLNFGDQVILEETLKRFQMTDLKEKFNRVVNLPNFESAGSFNLDFDYYIKIIPQIFYDEYTYEQFIAYQYSITSKLKERLSDDSMPVIMINYDYSPVAVKYTLKRRYFSHFLTNICALIGGVFVIFSIINSIMNKLSESLEEEVKVGRTTIN